MYSGNRLIELLEKQHETRSQQSEKYKGLFKKGTFTIQWRAKVGYFPHPDAETIVSAGEPCGAWKITNGRPEDKRNVGDNLKLLPVLPLNGYIPGSSIRGLVRSWAKQRPEIKPRMLEILGFQDNENITPGKIEFLDAWPENATKLTLDIVNPQEPFQVYHQDQSKPLSFYTLGNGEKPINLTVAIRGIPGKVTEAEVDEVWGWVQQALSLYGVGSRTASGYGAIKSSTSLKIDTDPEYSVKQFDFRLFSQGCYGAIANPGNEELRPSHWRGWLRSWTLRFLLGVMSEDDAEITLGELFGTLESKDDKKSRKGLVRLKIIQDEKDEKWGDPSTNKPDFYHWKGKLQISAPEDIQEKIILPIIKFAASLGGVGRGWRRPLHIFSMKITDKKTKETRQKPAPRGTHLILTHRIDSEPKRFAFPPDSETWKKAYKAWQKAVKSKWPERFTLDNNDLRAEVFSPETCAVYLVPGPKKEPVDHENNKWNVTNPSDTRGEGMKLIYQPTYKGKPHVGGDAAGGSNAHCSWVSIKRIPVKQEGTKEIVCLFMGETNNLRSQFLNDLSEIPGAVHLFGVQPPTQQ